MYTYESFTNELLNSAKDASLDAYNIRNKIDIQTCTREFSCCFALSEKKPPIENRAEIYFQWDTLITSESIYGGNCSLYHDDYEMCTHQQLVPEMMIELEISYKFKANESGIIDLTNKKLNELFERVMTHENIPLIKWELLIDRSGQKIITDILATHIWNIDLADNDIDFIGICIEINSMLKGLEELDN